MQIYLYIPVICPSVKMCFPLNRLSSCRATMAKREGASLTKPWVRRIVLKIQPHALNVYPARIDSPPTLTPAVGGSQYIINRAFLAARSLFVWEAIFHHCHKPQVLARSVLSLQQSLSLPSIRSIMRNARYQDTTKRLESILPHVTKQC
jgi:hypothetical protein